MYTLLPSQLSKTAQANTDQNCCRRYLTFLERNCCCNLLSRSAGNKSSRWTTIVISVRTVWWTTRYAYHESSPTSPPPPLLPANRWTAPTWSLAPHSSLWTLNLSHLWSGTSNLQQRPLVRKYGGGGVLCLCSGGWLLPPRLQIPNSKTISAPAATRVSTKLHWTTGRKLSLACRQPPPLLIGQLVASLRTQPIREKELRMLSINWDGGFLSRQSLLFL